MPRMRTSWLLCVALVGCVAPDDIETNEAIDELGTVVYQDPPPQLLAAYAFEGNNGTDSGPLHLDLSNRGTTSGTDRYGRVGRATHVAQTDYWVSLVEEPFDLNALTISMWVYQEYLPQNATNAYCDKSYLVAKYNWTAEPTNAYGLFLEKCPQSAYENLRFWYDNAQGGYEMVDTGYTLSVIHKWTHIAVSRASGVVKLYVNGQLVRTRIHAGPAMYNDRKVTIGGIAWWSQKTDNWGFHGDIDDVRFYSNQLTDAQVAALAVY